jgi:sugar-phosphatase
MQNGERALVFDMDGVLIDSEPLWRRAEMETFREVGLVLAEADCFQTQGLRIDEAVAFWYERAPWSGRSCDDVAKSIVSRMGGLIRSEGEPMPDAVASIEWALNSSWRLALASSSSKFLIETVLDRFGITSLFECTRSAEDEISGKPHPGVYLSAARELRLEPGACVAVEDSVHGMASALSAGMRCIAIPPPEIRNDPRFEAATLRLDSLRDLPGALEALEV